MALSFMMAKKLENNTLRWLQNSLQQFFKVIFDKHEMTKSLVSRGFLFHKTVDPTIIVHPVKTAFSLPALGAVFLLPYFLFSNFLSIVFSSSQARFYVSSSKLFS